ncbi:phosphoribosyltransferase [Brucella anthropi]|uniref:Phosphoribosyltransferase n=1 Tax=Brucella anthropi TaxID=529 RepID=A0A6I0DU67_BRUAN|nr:phosphoribosyltransferase [Brucella anthropi]KAB2799231.1 phosphoribosyltransferase [Brucella anthropi]
MVDISVKTFVRYNAGMIQDRTSDEWKSIHIKKIIKGECLNPKAKFTWSCLNGATRSIIPSLTSVFLNDLYSRFANQIMTDFGTNLALVPVPNGVADANYPDNYRTLELAKGIASASNSNLEALDALRWKQAAGQAHKNEKRRDVDQYISNLIVSAKTTKPIVLFDDVITSGSQLASAKIALEEAGLTVVGLYAVMDVLDENVRGSAPAWITVERSPLRITDLFDDFGPIEISL